MFAVYASTVTKMHDPVFTAIDFEVDVDGRRGRLSVPGYVEMSGEPIRNKANGAGIRAQIVFRRDLNMKSPTSAALPAEQPVARCSWRSTANTGSSPICTCPAMGSSAADLTARLLRHERALIAAVVAARSIG